MQNLLHTDRALPAIFHITHWKAGSQWIRQVLEAWQPQRIITPLTEVGQFIGQPILPGMIYPTLYITRSEFEAASVPEPHVKFLVIRDLRDTLISEYFSARYSHVDIYEDSMSRLRQGLDTHSLEDGLRFEMRRFLPFVVSIQTSWMNSDVPVFRFEDFLLNEYEQFHRLFACCRAELPPRQLQRLIADFSFEKLTGRSRGDENVYSHYRKGVAGDWRNYLKGPLLAEFKERYDDVLIETGYETSHDWGLAEIPRFYSVSDPITRFKETGRRQYRCWCSIDSLMPFSPEYDKCSACGSLVRKSLETENRRTDLGDPITYGSVFADKSRKFYRYGVGMDSYERARFQFSNKVMLDNLRVVTKYKVPGARLLDASCGLGAFVALMRQAGFDAIGLDSSQQAIEFARRTFNVPVQVGTLSDNDLVPGSFDAIVLINVIEHLPDPLLTLTQCMSLLAKDGILVLNGQLFDDTHTFEELRRTSLSTVGVLNPLENLYLFTPRAYRLLLERVSCHWTDNDLSGVTVAAQQAIPEIHDKAPLDSAGAYVVQGLLDLLDEAWSLQRRLTQDRNIAFNQLQRIMWPSPGQVLQHDLLTTGQGWHSVESYQGDTFCWIDNDAELIVHFPSGKRTTLEFELEPGPGLNCEPFELKVLDQADTIVSKVDVRGREVVHLDLPIVAGPPMVFRLHVEGGLPTPNDPRILNFRVFQFGWMGEQSVKSETVVRIAQD